MRIHTKYTQSARYVHKISDIPVVCRVTKCMLVCLCESGCQNAACSRYKRDTCENKQARGLISFVTKNQWFCPQTSQWSVKWGLPEA